MNKNHQSYSKSNYNNYKDDIGRENETFYSNEKTEKNNENHNAFEKNDYSVRKMTFSKVKYVQK